MQQPWFYVVWALGAYLLGSIPIGDLVARAAGVNIRAVGTGNPGAANILREISPAHGAAVFGLDVAKGAVATVPIFLLTLPAWAGLMAATAVLAGHIFPLPWRSIGGTGMAVAIGVTAGLLPIGALVATPVAVAFLLATRNVGYTGGTFFAVALISGGLIHQDAVGALAVLLVGASVLVKARLQYKDG